MKINGIVTRLYPFSRIHLMKNRTVSLNRCVYFEPDTRTLHVSGRGKTEPMEQEEDALVPAASDYGSLASVRKGFASQCGYVYNGRGTLVHGLTHKYRPGGNYKPLSRVCEKVTGRRPGLFGFSCFSGDVAVATASTQRYYYHWMVDVLPRIEMIRRTGFKGMVYADVTLPYQRETVECVWPDVPILDAVSYPLITADRLLVPVHQVVAGNEFPDWIIALLKERVLGPHAQPEPGRYPERVYIIRNRSARRCVTNEQELCEKLATYGFHCLAMEDMSVEEQAKHFFNAEIIVAPHGGGLTNLVFSRSTARCVELFGRYDKVVYERICRSVGMEYRKLNGSAEEDEYGRFHEDFSIDPDSVAQLLESMGVTPQNSGHGSPLSIAAHRSPAARTPQ